MMAGSAGRHYLQFAVIDFQGTANGQVAANRGCIRVAEATEENDDSKAISILKIIGRVGGAVTFIHADITADGYII